MVDPVVPPVVVPPVVVPPAAWHAGLDAEIIGLAQNKGWDLTDPVKAFTAATGAYGGAQKLIGLPPDKVMRMPEPSSEPAVLDAFWQRLGAVKDAKEIDFSSIKDAAGNPISEKLADALRATAVAGRIPKDAVLATAAAVQKHFDAEAAAAATIRAGSVLEEQTALDRSWGANKAANMFIANQALEKLAAAANMPLDKAKSAWDALTKIGGIGAAASLEMLHVMGRRMGEDKYVAGGGAGGGNGLPMTREAAQAEITALKADEGFRKRLLAGDREANNQWTALHKIGYAVAA
jgi:hypothetical protein